VAEEFPLKRYFSLSYSGFAQNTDGYLTIFKAPFAGYYTAATFMSNGDITGHATVRRDLKLYRGSPDGMLGNNGLQIQFLAGVNAEPQHEIAFSEVNADLHRYMEEGDYCHLHSDAVGGGVADPGGLIIVEFTRDLGEAPE
jgi:hypothetical protein